MTNNKNPYGVSEEYYQNMVDKENREAQAFITIWATMLICAFSATILLVRNFAFALQLGIITFIVTTILSFLIILFFTDNQNSAPVHGEVPMFKDERTLEIVVAITSVLVMLFIISIGIRM